MMIVILILAVFEFIFVHIPVEGSNSSPIPIKTSIKLYANDSASWNNASDFCKKKGGQLLTIDSQTKRDLMKCFYNLNPSPGTNGGYSWIGLHTRQIDGYECKDSYFWQNCQPLSSPFNKYASNTNTKTCEHERCITMKHDLKWTLEACDSRKSFFCEFDNGTCSYRLLVQENPGKIATRSRKIELKANTSCCRDYCDKTLMNYDWPCWFFSMREPVNNSTEAMSEWKVKGLQEQNKELQECDLYYFKEVFLQDIYERNSSANGTKFYIKDCFQGEVVNDYKLDGIACVDETFPNVTCHIDESCYFEKTADSVLENFINNSTTLDIEGTVEFCKTTCLTDQSCWFINRFSHISNFCRLYYLEKETLKQHVGKNREDFRDTLFIKRCPKEDDETTTGESTTTTTAKPETNTKSLLVDKKQTSQYRNKFISVYEGTVSKVISGVVGTFFIALIVGFVVISDFPTLLQHAKTIGAKNIRNRNICCKKGKRKKKASAVKPTNTNKTVEDDGV